MTDEDKPLTLSREDLYELVWSKPMLELAIDFGISDRGLAKRCKRLGIPVPGRGYWARVDAGQAPYRPKLPKRGEKWSDQSALTVAPAIGAYTSALVPSEELEATASADGTKSVPTRISELSIVASTSILDALAPIKRTALRCKHSLRAQLSFQRGEKAGPVVELEVTAEVLDRALLLADTLVGAAQHLGWVFDDPLALNKVQGRPAQSEDPASEADKLKETAEPCRGRLLVEGEQVAFRIEERFRTEAREPTAHELSRERREYNYHAPRKLEIPTGALRVVRIDTYRSYGPERRSWYDRKGKRVEEQLPEILLGFYELALSIKSRRAKDEQEARERKERQRRQEEWEAIQDANQKLIDQLETDAGAWHRARYLRRYLHAARRELDQCTLQVRFRDQTIDFLAWAERYINQIDPLQATRRTGEFEPKSGGYYYNDLERMKKAFGRLLGSDWSSAWKRGKDYTPKPTTGWSYREKSVFEVEPAESNKDEIE
jgi:hypothetical protein